jgi:cobalt/nickel transport system ATP-binding protein
VVNIENWTVTYPDGTVAVDHFNLKIAPGEHLALIGANGAGKSSLILSLVGVLPGEGSVTVDGVPLDKEHLTAIRTKVGVVFQNPDDQLFLPTIYDDIAFGPRNLGLDEESVRYRVEDRLNLLHISHLRDRTALKLSGGEKRMAALATVLAMKPSVMVLDEPTAFLDPKARRNLIQVLKKLPHTMLIATHDLAFAAEVCQRSVLLRAGKVFADGQSRALLYDERKMDEAGVEAIGVFLGGTHCGTT